MPDGECPGKEPQRYLRLFLFFVDQRHGMRLHAFLPSDETELFGGRRFDRYLFGGYAHRCGQCAGASLRCAVLPSGVAGRAYSPHCRCGILLRKAARLCAATRILLSIPLKSSDVSGKCRPISPSAAAPSKASHSAWITTSPSEWAMQPASCSIFIPPSHSSNPGAKAWTSYPCPILKFPITVILYAK